MRKLIFAINTTLDGCVDHTSQSVDDEALAYFTQLTRDSGVQVFGRKTWQLMVPYWPEAATDPSSTKTERDFAVAFNSIEKVVFSRSLKSILHDLSCACFLRIILLNNLSPAFFGQ